MELHCRQRIIAFPRRPLVMGIVNINDDSFCGDGTLDISAAMEQAQRMVGDGADIVDVGAESARTNRGPISVADEIARLEPFITAFHAAAWAAPADTAQVYPPLLSINTWRPEVAAALLPLGVDILNDLSALPDQVPAQLCLEHQTALLIMHTVGQPKVAHTHVGYDDILATLEAFFSEKLELARSAGLTKSQVILDPGIDFAKQRDDNLRIYAGLQRLQQFDVPVLLPVSRKSVIGHVLGIAAPTERDAGTVACIQMGIAHGAHIFRVHQVTAAYQAIKLLDWLERP
jgi:dihydropteroate synthase